jgi:hypothetical protein
MALIISKGVGAGKFANIHDKCQVEIAFEVVNCIILAYLGQKVKCSLEKVIAHVNVLANANAASDKGFKSIFHSTLF